MTIDLNTGDIEAIGRFHNDKRKKCRFFYPLNPILVLLITVFVDA